MISRKLILCWSLGLLALAAGCGSNNHEADTRFTAVAQQHLDKMLPLNPEWATNLGDHRFDHQVSDLSEKGFKARVALNRQTLAALEKITADDLSPVNRIDYAILRDACESAIFEITELREYRWNPTFYNPGDGLYNILARDYAPLDERLLAVKSRLEALPKTLAAARDNLDNPPRVMTETAIRQNPGVINLVFIAPSPAVFGLYSALMIRLPAIVQ